MEMWIKNPTGGTVLRANQYILAGEYHLIEEAKVSRWKDNDQVLTDLGNGDLIMARSDDGTQDITKVSEGINFLKGVTDNSVVVREEWVPDDSEPTGSHYQAQSFEIDIDQAQGDWKVLDISFPFPISVFSTEWVNESLYNGDVVQVLVDPDKVTGALTSNIAVDDTVINVSSTVLKYTAVGYRLAFDDGTNYEDLGRVLEMDKDAGTVTMESAATQAFAAVTPTEVKQTVDFIPGIMLKGTGRVELAKDIIGGTHLRKNQTLRIRYKNVEGTTIGKCFSFILEYKH